MQVQREHEIDRVLLRPVKRVLDAIDPKLFARAPAVAAVEKHPVPDADGLPLPVLANVGQQSGVRIAVQHREQRSSGMGLHADTVRVTNGLSRLMHSTSLTASRFFPPAARLRMTVTALCAMIQRPICLRLGASTYWVMKRFAT